MNTTCRLITVAVMLLHSIFGYNLHHACACELHTHGAYQHVAGAEPTESCQHDYDHERRHGESPCCHDHEEDGEHGDDIRPNASVSNGCNCCQKAPCERSDAPCCSEVQCSFILGNDIEFSLDAGPFLFVVVDDESALWESSRAKIVGDPGRLSSGVDDSLSRCALHCSWQL